MKDCIYGTLGVAVVTSMLLVVGDDAIAQTYDSGDAYEDFHSVNRQILARP